jgi:hypothetical protein
MVDLDVQAMLAVEDGQKVVYASCTVGQERLSIVLWGSIVQHHSEKVLSPWAGERQGPLPGPTFRPKSERRPLRMLTDQAQAPGKQLSLEPVGTHPIDLSVDV